MSPLFNCLACGSQTPYSGAPFAFCPACGAPSVQPAATVPAIADEAIALPEERPFIAGEMIGWRAWQPVTLGKLVRLHSVTHRSHWPTQEWTIAECHGKATCSLSSDGRIPGERCTCGMYAAKTREQLTETLAYGHYGRDTRVEDIRVIGEVAMAGKVIEGSQGWRAERARIAKVYVPHTHWKLGQAIASQYGCEVERARWI